MHDLSTAGTNYAERRSRPYVPLSAPWTALAGGGPSALRPLRSPRSAWRPAPRAGSMSRCAHSSGCWGQPHFSLSALRVAPDPQTPMRSQMRTQSRTLDDGYVPGSTAVVRDDSGSPRHPRPSRRPRLGGVVSAEGLPCLGLQRCRDGTSGQPPRPLASRCRRLGHRVGSRNWRWSVTEWRSFNRRKKFVWDTGICRSDCRATSTRVGPRPALERRQRSWLRIRGKR